MWNVLSRARDRFVRDQRGNIAILFGFAAVPMVGLLGGAVDFTRHSHYRTEILNVMDSAAVALARRGARNDADADAFVNGFIGAMLTAKDRDRMLHLDAFNAVKIPGGYRVASSGYMDTAFMPVVGIRRLPLNLSSEVQSTAGNYEVALALDNTGSMAQRNKIGALREAAGKLVDDLYREPGAADRVKMALVPFVTGVNVRGAAFDWSWIDRTGTAPHALDIFDKPVDRVALAEKVDPSEGWKGCVEARDGDADLNDAPPDSPATRWLPWFWPDEYDNARGANDYVKDQSAGSVLQRLINTAKYERPILTVSTMGATKGPNASCAGPIVELTKDTDRMRAAIDAMVPHPGSGTNIAQGMAWAWRVLSPGEPFTEGAPYDDAGTEKALVLLSDGKNEIGDDYTSYGYIDNGRLGKTVSSAVAQMNKNVETVCQRVKEKKIRLYMILFQENDAKTQQIFKDCASVNEAGERLYYYAPDDQTLNAAFASIGQDITSIHISR